MKKIFSKILEFGGLLFISLIFIGIFLYFLGYFNKLQFFWIIIFLVIAWLIYIYRYLEEEYLNKK